MIAADDRVPCPLCGGSGCFDCGEDGMVRGPDAPILDRPEIGARVTFASIDRGREFTGFVAAHGASGSLRVMDVLEPLEGNNWSWSEWITEWAIATEEGGK